MTAPAGRRKALLPRCRTDKPYTIRFRTPREGTTVVKDLIKGDVVFENRELDDLIIARTDGTPTYNFCVVVDDIDMAISHIIRGDDHLSNTPRQIHFYQALGSPLPQFAHVPLILGTDKARLSKRHGATSVTAYRDMGFFAEAVVNYLVRLAWSHGDQEIFSRQELLDMFSLEHVGKSAGVFNPEKFLWVNFHYLKSKPLSQLAEEVVPYIQAQGLSSTSGSPVARKDDRDFARARQDFGRAGGDGAVLSRRSNRLRREGRDKVFKRQPQPTACPPWPVN